MMLEAVWLKDGEEVYCVSPVMNIVCDSNMDNVGEIEINNRNAWYSCEENRFDADDFIIRIKKQR